MQLLRGDAPAAAARGNTAPQPGTAAPAAAGSCRAQLRDKAAQVACGSPSSLPVPFATAQEPGSPSEPPGKHQRLAAELNGRRAGRLLSAGKLERLIEELQKELLAVLQQQGPTTEGIFCKVESARALQELRQALDHGLHVDMASQPVLLLAMVLKVSPPELQLQRLLPGPPCSKAHRQPLALQDFLRSIPGKLLVTDLYEDWMAAMQMASREDKISQLKAVAKKLPAASLLLLQQLLAVLRCIGQHASSSRVTCSSLDICLGPSLLSPPQEEQLELQVLLAENDKPPH
ncbi:T-cell activation Rho GTPase-activating protein-like isoform X4 [Corvus cornix cornix]|uniref:T-cell activation Rho GTPase-activating protein-like isoform X4 n=1 Tax=Corvus cornix cornix TaxID=932674 RepID=UPI0019503F34|nr:T-cell activation Rho GTPase-activating protein-like isoform X4 [Corvus cornix cornix]